jgi:hypothetical protein
MLAGWAIRRRNGIQRLAAIATGTVPPDCGISLMAESSIQFVTTAHVQTATVAQIAYVTKEKSPVLRPGLLF